MSDDQSTPADDQDDATTGAAGGDDQGDADTTDWKAEAEKWKTASRKHENRAKDNAKAARELEELKRTGMSEAEAAVAKARDEAKGEARKEFGGRLVEAEVRGRAATRLSDDQVATLLDGLNTSRFLDDDGEVDTARVHEWVDKLAPARKRDDEDEGGTNGARGGSGMGQGRGRGKGVTGMSAGAARYEERKQRTGKAS
jgi:hypothetical protein